MTQSFTALLLNLDRDTERRAHMEAQLARAAITFTRLPGILGDNLPSDLRGLFFDHVGKPRTSLKRGEIGCYASHLYALRRAARGDADFPFLVMEDDLDLPADLTDIIYEALQMLPPGWDILRLSSSPRSAYIPVASLKKGVLARYSKIPNSAGAYLVTSAGARKFLSDGMRGLTFDDDLRRPWFHGMKTYGIVPPPVKAGILKSSIDAIEAGRFDKPVGSGLERVLRGDHIHMLRRVSYNIRDLGVANWLRCAGVNCANMIGKALTGHKPLHTATQIFPERRS